jgi:hypothetical protein
MASTEPAQILDDFFKLRWRIRLIGYDVCDIARHQQAFDAACNYTGPNHKLQDIGGDIIQAQIAYLTKPDVSHGYPRLNDQASNFIASHLVNVSQYAGTPAVGPSPIGALLQSLPTSPELAPLVRESLSHAMQVVLLDLRSAVSDIISVGSRMDEFAPGSSGCVQPFVMRIVPLAAELATEMFMLF